MSELRNIRNVLKTRRKNFDQQHSRLVRYQDPDREEDDFRGIELEIHAMDEFFRWYESEIALLRAENDRIRGYADRVDKEKDYLYQHIKHLDKEKNYLYKHIKRTGDLKS